MFSRSADSCNESFRLEKKKTLPCVIAAEGDWGRLWHWRVSLAPKGSGCPCTCRVSADSWSHTTLDGVKVAPTLVSCHSRGHLPFQSYTHP